MTTAERPAAEAGGPLSTPARQSLRSLIADDSYAVTFQSMGQYRAALLQHLTNLDAAEQAAQLTATWE